jgi:hypothetical protein
MATRTKAELEAEAAELGIDLSSARNNAERLELLALERSGGATPQAGAAEAPAGMEPMGRQWRTFYGCAAACPFEELPNASRVIQGFGPHRVEVCTRDGCSQSRVGRSM